MVSKSVYDVCFIYFRFPFFLIFKAGIELSLGDKGSLMRHKIGDHENDISVNAQSLYHYPILPPE